jgi:Ca-activated chloride channel family protein
MGNILLLTDSDDNQESFKVDIPKGISLGVVALASKNGGPIPMKDPRGGFYGYKTYKGQKVISKLDERFLKDLEKKVKYYKYWESSTMDFPTDEIVSFFHQAYNLRLSERNVEIRPVYTQFVVIFAIALFILSVLLSRVSRGKNIALAIFLLIIPTLVLPAEKDTGDLISRLKEGELKSQQRLKLAEYLLKEKKFKEAAILYKEELKNNPGAGVDTSLNYGTAQVLSGDVEKGLQTYAQIYPKIETSPYLQVLRNNVLMALKVQQQQKEQKEENEKKGKSKTSKGDQGQKGKQNQKSSDGGKDNAQDKGEGPKPKKEPPPKEDSLEKKEQESQEKRKNMNVPAKIKQIIDDDRKLQQQFLDTSTQQNKNDEEIKDW